MAYDYTKSQSPVPALNALVNGVNPDGSKTYNPNSGVYSGPYTITGTTNSFVNLQTIYRNVSVLLTCSATLTGGTVQLYGSNDASYGFAIGSSVTASTIPNTQTGSLVIGSTYASTSPCQFVYISVTGVTGGNVIWEVVGI